MSQINIVETGPVGRDHNPASIDLAHENDEGHKYENKQGKKNLGNKYVCI